MYDFKELITEGNTIRIESAQFSIHPYDNYSIIFMAKSTADLDIINNMYDTYVKEAIKLLNKKTKMEWSEDTKYPGAGFAVKTNKYSFKEYIQKIIT